MTVTPPTSSSSNMSSGTMATSDHPVHGRCRATIQADPRRLDPRPTSPGRRLRSESGSTADFAERVALKLGVLPFGAQGPAPLILSPLVLGELGTWLVVVISRISVRPWPRSKVTWCGGSDGAAGTGYSRGRMSYRRSPAVRGGATAGPADPRAS